ncbi:UNVERIFIED_CONTAM: Calcium-dependent protein kinase [Sesamum radiatum]|uniref:non-specific serine/threonine protein kinase n=1 Tax=Sesamum radiatum TaxID=300843 RepID=A0AAW2QDX9_SESRA
MKRLSGSSSKPSYTVLPHQTPRLRDHYTLGRKLGEGQFGTTFHCIEKGTGTEYACKSIAKRKLLCREDYEDVWKEVQIMHHLSEHPNVVRIKGTYEDTLFVHLVMELCAGGELFDRIVQRGHYTEKKAAHLMKTIVGVVEACHSLGVMHRDLKPENFLFDTPDEDAKLKATDFGLSVFYKPGQYLSDVVGSPYYVAPEVLHKFYGPEADVWSAGVILYILLCGVPPFWAGEQAFELNFLAERMSSFIVFSSSESLLHANSKFAETDNGIFRQILNGKLDLDSEPWPHISDSAKDLVQKMLDRNPKRRLSAHQVLCHSRKTFRRRDRWIETVVQNDRYTDSGAITFDELKQGLKRVGSELTESEIQALMEAADVDNNGTIDYGEFLAATLHMNKIEREENLAAAFSFFDKDGSGYITIDELQQACKDFGIAEAHLDDMIKEADTDNDGRIDYGEFAAMMRKGNPALASRTQRGNLNFNLADALQGKTKMED